MKIVGAIEADTELILFVAGYVLNDTHIDIIYGGVGRPTSLCDAARAALILLPQQTHTDLSGR